MRPKDTPWFAYIATLVMTVAIICGINAVIHSRWLKPEAQITNTTYQAGYEAGRAEGYKNGFAEALMFKPHMSDADRHAIIDAVLAYDGTVR